VRTAAIVMTSSLAAATGAFAASSATDVDYLKASRCKGIATGVGGVDTAQLDAFLKRERGARLQTIIERGDAAQAAARREARVSERRPKLAAELQGACAVYMNGGREVARHGIAPTS
jgi:hypothetical protein